MINSGTLTRPRQGVEGFALGVRGDQQRRIVAYLDGLWAKVDALEALQAQTQASFAPTLLPGVLDRAFEGESCIGSGRKPSDIIHAQHFVE